MASYGLTRFLFKLLTKNNIISIGTKYYPATPLETEYVEMFNYTQTMLMEIKKAGITTDNILENLLRDIGAKNIPENYHFYELKPAENKIEEYALVSNIIMSGDRYLYVELSNTRQLINQLSKVIMENKGEIVENSSTEIVSKLLSKNDAIKVAIKIVGIGLKNGVNIRATVGMSAAAAIERSINFTKEIGDIPGVSFTKLGGEYALTFDSNFINSTTTHPELSNYLFIDIIDSTKFINDYGRDKLVELMTNVKNFMKIECDGKIEAHREGGDDIIASFPSKDLAIRAGLDTAWYILNNGAKIRAGIGKSRKEAGERAQLADKIQIIKPLSLVIFDMANGFYAYYIPSEFIRTILNLILNKKSKLIGIFILIFLFTYLMTIKGHWEYGFIAIILATIYAITT